MPRQAVVEHAQGSLRDRTNWPPVGVVLLLGRASPEVALLLAPLATRVLMPECLWRLQIRCVYCGGLHIGFFTLVVMGREGR